MNCFDTVHGFKVTRVREAKEINAVLYEMEHIRTGASLAWLKRDDENKTFGIAFRTLPQDDTGVFHILEHSVLCGSRKYRVKDPFVGLLKSSMQTFLNALTYPDKTVYPVSSRNGDDFLNLVSVYLDAVFYPAFYNNKNIFMQEGWHYETDGGEKLCRNGVVFNEMRGVFSSDEAVSSREINRLLYPDTCYGYVSGGDPESIPDLTYEKFIETHKKYYHPSNSVIFLDGNVDIEKTLALIDGEYLSAFEKKAPIPLPDFQKTVNSVRTKEYYEISPEKESDANIHMTAAKCFGSFKDKTKGLALSVICDVLTGTNSSPLKKALLEEKLAQDVYMQYSDGILQPTASITVRGIKPNDEDRVLEKIRICLNEQAEKGIDKSDIEASLNQLEFSLRAVGEPRGLYLCLSMLDSWMYGGDPLSPLCFDGDFEFLRSAVGTDYYEKLLKEAFCSEDGTVTLFMYPSKTLGDEKRAAEEQQLRKISEKIGRDELEKIKNDFEALKEWQQRPETEEDEATLPKLTLSQVSSEPQQYNFSVDSEGFCGILKRESKKEKISYINLYFDMSDISYGDLPYAALLAEVMGELSTVKYSSAELVKKIKTHIGSLAMDVRPFKNDGVCKVKLCIRMGVLGDKVKDALETVREILVGTRLDEKDKISEIAVQIKELFYQSIIMSGDRFARLRAAAHFNDADSVRECVNGISFFEKIKSLAREDAELDGCIEKMRGLKEKIISSARLIASIDAGVSAEDIEEFAKKLPAGEAPQSITKHKPLGSGSEGFVIPAGVSYAVLCGNASEYEEHSGEFAVLSKILSLDYLWKQVRMIGGAYGTGFRVNIEGVASFHSYRDPSPENSLRVYRESAEYLKEFTKNTADIEPYIIGALGESEPLVGPQTKGLISDEMYFKGITNDDLRKRRRQIMECTPEKLAGLISVLERVKKEGEICVIGPSSAVDESLYQKIGKI